MFKAVDTMRSQTAQGDSFGSRLLAKKAELRGSLSSDLYPGTVTSNNRLDQFNRLDQD